MELIAAHYKLDSEMKDAKLFLTNQDRIIRILELTESAPSCSKPSPFNFDAALSEGVPYPSSVILVNQKDWNKIIDGKMKLPIRWNMKNARNVSKEEVASFMD